MSYHPTYGHPPPGHQPDPCCQIIPVHYPPPGHQPDPCHQTTPVCYPPQQSGPRWVSQVYTIPTEPAPIPRHPVHRAAQYPRTGHRPRADETSPLPRRTSYRKGSERVPSGAYDHPSSRSKPKDQSRMYDQPGARLEQPLPPTKAIEYQARKHIDQQAWYADDATTIVRGPESSRDNLDKNGNDKKKPTSSQRVRTTGEPEEQKKPTSSQRVRTKGEPEEQKQPTSSQRIRKKGEPEEQKKPTSSQQVRSESEPEEQKKPTSSQQVRSESEPEEQTRVREWVESLPERKHKTKEPTSSKQAYTKGDPSDPSDHGHTQKLINSQPYVADKQAKGSFVDSAGDERKHTTKNPTSFPHLETDSKRRPEEPAEQAKERSSTKTTDTGRAHITVHSSSDRPPKREVSGTSTPAKKSTGHQSKKITKEEVQTFSLEKGRKRVTVAYSLPKG